MNLYDIYEIKKRADIPTIIKHMYKNEENKIINESTITDGIMYLSNTDVLEKKRSNNKDSYYLKDKTKDLETPYEYEVKTSPTDHPNTASENHDYVNSTPEQKICNIKTELVALKSFVIEQIYVLEKHLEEKKVSPEASNLLKLLQEKISDLRDENKMKSEIIGMLPHKQNTYRCLYTNTTDTAVPEKQAIDQDTIPTKPTKTTDS